MVTPRGETERERGGGAARPQKGGGRSLLTPARTDCPRRVSGGGGPPRRGGGYTRSPQAPALVLTQLSRPWKVREYRLLPLVTICTSGPSNARLAGSAPELEPEVTLSARRRALVGRLRRGRRRRAGDSLSWPERAEISPPLFCGLELTPPPSSLYTSPRGLTTR